MLVSLSSCWLTPNALLALHAVLAMCIYLLLPWHRWQYGWGGHLTDDLQGAMPAVSFRQGEAPVTSAPQAC